MTTTLTQTTVCRHFELPAGEFFGGDEIEQVPNGQFHAA